MIQLLDGDRMDEVDVFYEHTHKYTNRHGNMDIVNIIISIEDCHNSINA